MPTYLYCVRSDRPEVPIGLVGIDDAPVRSIDADTLVAWVSDAESASIAVTVERVKAHDAVCSAALSVGDTPLPIRFGQSFANDDGAREAIGARRVPLASRLARVSGCVELRVVIRHVADPSQAAQHPADVVEDANAANEGPGTAFLRRLARVGRADIAREVSCEEVRHRVREAAGMLVVDQHPCEAARGISYFPMLVRRGDVGELRTVLRDRLSSQAIDLSILGPFTPYSFAGDA